MSDQSVNSQITDAVTQLNAMMVGESPPQSMAMINAVMADTMGMALHNAVSTQHHAQMIGGASTTSTCARMLGILAPPDKTRKAADAVPKAAKTGSKFFDCDICSGTASQRRAAEDSQPAANGKQDGENGGQGILAKFAELFKKHHQKEHEEMNGNREQPEDQAGAEVPEAGGDPESPPFTPEDV
ncbi:Killing trait domain-containing protein [Desulfatibacillum alkenivorans DSM 16219]|jgi:hypothetical protein|uniref:Killing trait domain-containing protein n=1 Tax=Desulfatibacillum alkenivorans DSM 16219 TaxID=1121393 RepID=A0A1M6R0M1_9BACT|nr:RebB family R body protein [Desulfatibacillum alkenivorans]SHK25984.1 Killing trait domain-containing protein [Desulfatibacillum alkenivorans DSM 16219]